MARKAGHRDSFRLTTGEALVALQEIKQLVDMYDSQASAAPQLRAFLASLARHRQQLEQQRDDIEVTLAEIQQHEKRCRALLAG